MSFLHDLKAGEDVEQEILRVIQKSFPHAQKETGQYCRDFFDIIIPKKDKQPEIKIEVKADLYKSKNLAFECLGRGGKSTGIIKTTANYWFHFRNDKYLIWEMVRLKKYLLNVGGHLKGGGDDKATTMWVIPEDKVMKECPPDAIIDKGSDEINTFLLSKLK